MKLTIITVCLNDKEGLTRTINSVINQTNKEFQFIVIDGGSSDGSIEVLKQYDNHISYWISEPDKGVYNAMNKGVSMAKGEYCLFLNANDELFDQDVIAKFLNEDPNEDILSGSEARSNEYNRIEYIIHAPKEIDLLFFARFSLTHQSTFIRTDRLKEMPFDESYKIQSDFIFFFKSFFEKQASYKKLNFLISNFKLGGISTTQYQLMHKEREHYFLSFLSPLAVDNLMFYSFYQDLLSNIKHKTGKGKVILFIWSIISYINRIGLILKEKKEQFVINKKRRL